MSCDHSTYNILADLDQSISPGTELGDDGTASKTHFDRRQSLKQVQRGLAPDKAESKGCRHQAQARIISDSTQSDPEYVWGDEGPIND